MIPNCYGQKFGHDFPYPGAYCLKCGVSQNELSGKGPQPVMRGGLSGITIAIPQKPVRGMHSEIHALVSEARTMFGETAKKGKGSFGFYLGFFKRVGTVRVRQLLAECREANDPKKSFWWHMGRLSRVKVDDKGE